ncbi:protein ABCI12, chloroplastic-like isoform X2 [Actinidia eriantha]|uniref:protein ABCI12, chloroplastic-like isoform X2 n=1 Tax=Actinidia eriantha TaxID=165200 RepID=UPI00258436F8|nr:protein ABCI12, chloroplastic-like isoform X2 [Actinidia eriantha]
MKLGPLQFTRKGLSIARTSACLTFTIFPSASLCLTTTTPEQLAYALLWLPLKNLGVPVTEIILTLQLSLRFLNLVFDEVRNVALGIVSRRINWEQLTFMETSRAMIVRGFPGDSNSHKISSESSIGMADILSLLCVVGLIGATAASNF